MYDDWNPDTAGMERVEPHRHIYLCREEYDVGACVFDAGYYFDDPFGGLNGPFETEEEAVAALTFYAESL